MVRAIRTVLIIACLIALDQLAKLWAMTYLVGAGPLPVAGRYLQLTYTVNTGAAFSLLENKRWFFVCITLALVAFCIYLLISRRLRGWFPDLALSLIVAGGIGNLIDRILRGYVVDFIYFIHFAIFNLADSCVVIGAVMMCIYLIRMETRPDRQRTVK